MGADRRKIEIDAETADALEAEAEARGTSVAARVAELIHAPSELPTDLESLRPAGRGPWAPEVLAEDARRLADFERTGEGVPWEEVEAWMRSWGDCRRTPTP